MKRGITIILAATLMLSMVACSGGNDSNTQNDMPQDKTNTTPTTEEVSVPDDIEMTKVSIGDTITLDFVEMTIDEGGFEDEISISFGDGRKSTISSGRQQEGMKYIFISGTIKNLNTSPISSDVIGNVDVDGFTYEISPANFFTAGGDGGTDLAPLVEYTYKIFAAIPSELAENYQSITFNFDFNELFDATNYKNYDFEKRMYRYTVAFEEISKAAKEQGDTPDMEETGVSASGRAGSLWEKSYFVDEFNQPTDEAFVSNNEYLVGTFNNSATTNSNLTGSIIIDAENMAIMLYEYGRNTVKNASSNYDEAYNIKMKTVDGTTIEMTGTIWAGGDRIVIDEQYRSAVIDALSALPVGDVAFVSFYIEQSDRPTNNYLLMVPMSNFGDVIGTLTE